MAGGAKELSAGFGGMMADMGAPVVVSRLHSKSSRRTHARDLAAREGIRSYRHQGNVAKPAGDLADIGDLARDIGFRPATTIEDGIARFAKCFDEYYKA
jgi:hypothetical protein